MIHEYKHLSFEVLELLFELDSWGAGADLKDRAVTKESRSGFTNAFHDR